jgi:cytochrome c peroxidase
MWRNFILLLLLVFIVAFSTIKRPTAYQFPILKFFPPMPKSTENIVTIEGADLGRYLFYDKNLSKDNSISCASCHKQGNAFSDSPNRFSKGRKNSLTKRNTMPLFNLAWYPSFFWDGRAASIEEQVFHPVKDTNEMNLQWSLAVKRINASKFYKLKFKAAFGNQKIDSVLISKAIGQFLRTLISYQSKFDLVLSGKKFLTKDEYEGLVLMNDMTKGDCLHCHTSDGDALGTTRVFSNNGLDSASYPTEFNDKGLGGFTNKIADNGKFKIPSLRNIAITAPYMHDGRFKTLEEVLDFYSEGVYQNVNIDSKMEYAHQKGVRLSLKEKHKIISFLKTLTDSIFITNPAFGNPYKQ